MECEVALAALKSPKAKSSSSAHCPKTWGGGGGVRLKLHAMMRDIGVSDVLG